MAAPNAFILYSNIAKAPVLTFEEQLNSTRQYVRKLNRFLEKAVREETAPGAEISFIVNAYRTGEEISALTANIAASGMVDIAIAGRRYPFRLPDVAVSVVHRAGDG